MTTSIDAYFGEVRELLNQPPSAERWDDLCQWITLAWEEDATQVRTQWLDYIEGALSGWPEEVKLCPEDWRTFSRHALYALTARDTSPFAEIASAPDTYNDKGALSYSTSGSALLDYFTKAGTHRGRFYADVVGDMEECWKESPALTVRMIFYLRAVVRKARGFYRSDETISGQGARDESRKAMRWLVEKHPDYFYANMWLVPLVGVWKDLWHETLLDALDHERVYDLIEHGMKDPYNRELLAKYLPKHRSKSNTHTRRHADLDAFARGLRHRLGWNQRDYRRFKASGESHDFQRKLCTGRLWEINFNRIPGRALSQLVYHRGRRDDLTVIERYGLGWAYQEWLTEKKGGVNFTGYVHELVPIVTYGEDGSWEIETANKQFERLLELARGEDGKGLGGDVLCALDTSGSMAARVHDTTAYDVCIGLGVYFSALNEGVFKDSVVMFDRISTSMTLSGTFADRVRQITRAETAWGNTNFQSVIDELVRVRRRQKKIPASAFPKTLLVVSDMQFDMAGNNTRTNYEEAMRKLSAMGLGKMRIIWWHVTGKKRDMPARLDDEGVILIGGFSGAILKVLLDDGAQEEVVDERTGKARQLTPIEQMVRALDQEVLRLVRA